MTTTTNPSPNNNPEENPMNDTAASTTVEQRDKALDIACAELEGVLKNGSHGGVTPDYVIGTVEAKTPAGLEIGDVAGLSAVVDELENLFISVPFFKINDVCEHELGHRTSTRREAFRMLVSAVLFRRAAGLRQPITTKEGFRDAALASAVLDEDDRSGLRSFIRAARSLSTSDAGTVLIDLLVTALRNYRRAHENYIDTMSAVARSATQEVEWYRKGYGPTGLAPQSVHDATAAKAVLLAAASTARDTATAAGMVLFPEAK